MALADVLNHGYRIVKENPLLSKEDNRISGKCLFLSENHGHETNRLFPASMPAERFAFKGKAGLANPFITHYTK